MFRSVLVATDDSPAADTAVDRAIELAIMADAELHALYVIDRRVARTAAARDPFERIGERTLEAVERAAQSANVAIETSIEEGDPPAAILDYVGEHGIDLVVVGGKSKSTAERFFIGSTAEKVVRRASVSVLVVRD